MRNLVFSLLALSTVMTTLAQQSVNDPANDFTKTVAYASNLEVASGNPPNFNNDTGRFARTDTNTAYLIYKMEGLSNFSIEFWGVEGDMNTGDITVYGAETSCGTYTPIALTSTLLNENSSLRDLKVYNPVNTLMGINYLKIEISGGDADWKAQIGHVMLTGNTTETYDQSVTDPLVDYSLMLSYSSNLSQDSANATNYDNDGNRLVRSDVNTAFLEYQLEDVTDFGVGLWTLTEQDSTQNGYITAYVSEYGCTYTPITLTSAATNKGYRSLLYYTPVSQIPENSNFLKIELVGGNQAWKAQIGHIDFTYKRQSRNFYLSNSGNDNNDGSAANPWKTLDKISTTSLAAGDTIFFNSGDQFDGHFVVNGSGVAEKPIVITAYGVGKKPVITGEVGVSGGGDYQEAIYVENNDNIVFDGLEVHNERTVDRTGVDTEDAYGIYIVNSGNEVLNNFIFKNMTFKKVYAPKPVLDADSFNGLEVSAVTFQTLKNNVLGEEKNINNILMEDCYFEDIQRLGVHIKHEGGGQGIGNDSINANTNCVFRNNEFHYLGGTSILPIRTYNCLIEYNEFDHPGATVDPRMPGRGSSVWTWRCHNTVIQYNKCLSTRGYLDSHGIHIDHENVNTFVQYNYMEDCEGGFVEILGGNLNSVYRFNVSVNDGWRDNPGWANSNHTIWINEDVPSGTHYSDQNYIYNNTVYMDSVYTTSIDMNSKNTHIYNNIFHAAKGNIGGKQVRIINNGTDLYVSNNLFQGTINSAFTNEDDNPVSGNPLFHAEGALSKYGYQLKAGSPAINAGVAKLGPPIPGAGTGIFSNVPAYPNVDYYGNPIDLSSGTPNIGACNAKNGELVPSALAPVSSITLSNTNILLEPGTTTQLNAQVTPVYASDTSVVWHSNNTAIATVDANGLVTALSEGSTTISATTNDGGFVAMATVTIGAASHVVDPLNDFSIVTSYTSNLNLDDNIPTNFNNDASRIVRSDLNTAAIEYEIRNIIDFEVEYWVVDGDIQSGNLTIFTSIDGVNYTEQQLEMVTPEDGSSLRQLQVLTPINGLSSGTKYLKLELSGGDQAWKAQVGSIGISYVEEVPTSVTDPFDTLLIADSYSAGVAIETNNPVNFGNDAGRLVRTTISEESITYAFDEIVGFSIDFFGLTGDSDEGQLKTYTSSDNITYTEIALSQISYQNLGYRDVTTYQSPAFLPIETNYVKVELSGGNQAWKAQLGNITIEYVGTPNAAKEGKQLISETTTKSFGIFPNPVADLLHINGLETATKVSVFTMNGKTVLTQRVIDTLEVAHLEKGMYLLVVEGQTPVKFVKF